MGRRAVLVGLLILHGACGLAPALFRIENDFANDYAPARALWQGHSLDRLYERDAFQVEIHQAGIPRLGSFLPQPPANALLLLPLAALGPTAAKAAWTLLLALALPLSFLALRRALPLPSFFLALVFLLPTSSVWNALRYGQPYPLLLLLLSLSLLAALRNRPLLAGLLVAPVLVLKLYGIPFLLYWLRERRWRAVLGLALGGLALTTASMTALGLEPHAVYLREVLPRSFPGEVQDPYSPLWGSASSLAHRLFQHEPDLNPSPLTDWPAMAHGLARGGSVFLLLLAVLGAAPSGARSAWATLTLGALAASPLTQSYHFVLLILPVAILLAEALEGGQRGRAMVIMACLVFATSPAPHYFTRFASGWGNFAAYPRLVVVVGLLALSLRDRGAPRPALFALAGALLAGLTALPARAEDPWVRVEEAHGYLLAEPVACAGGLAWVTIEGDRLVVRAPDGSIRRAATDLASPRCEDGRLVTEPLTPAAVEAADRDRASGVDVLSTPSELVERDPATGATRTLFRGRTHRPRLSPDGSRVAVQAWLDGSWDIVVVERSDGRTMRVTRDPANEVEPSWMPEGDRLVFASDRHRGLGSTALYWVRVPAADQRSP